MIKLSEAREIMRMKDAGGKPIPFDFEGVTANLREGTGGERREYKGAFLPSGGVTSKESKKDPRNWANYTFTVQVPGKGRPITFHALTITKFNDLKVYI